MLFEGQSGLPLHLLATLVNGTSGNATFGMTTGTNGCDTSGALSYNGSSLLAMTGVMETEHQHPFNECTLASRAGVPGFPVGLPWLWYV